VDLPAPRTALGFDYGTRRIGVAVGSTVTGTGRGAAVVRNGETGPDWDHILALVDEWRPDLAVVGLPYNMDGSESALTRRAARFARRLAGRTGLRVATIDERLSSREAEAALKAARADGRRARRVTAEAVDMQAAAVILERWLATESGTHNGLP
jgi:putative Holliday junction resolvase